MSAENTQSNMEPGSGPISRRDFARNLAASALAAGTLVGVAAADATKDNQVKEGNAASAPAAEVATPAAKLAPEEHLLAVIQHLYPAEELTPQRLDAIKEQLAWYLRRSQLLSRFPLTNADEPTTLFAAYRGS